MAFFSPPNYELSNISKLQFKFNLFFKPSATVLIFSFIVQDCRDYSGSKFHARKMPHLANTYEKFSISNEKFELYLLLIYIFAQDFSSHLGEFNENVGQKLSKSLKIWPQNNP